MNVPNFTSLCSSLRRTWVGRGLTFQFNKPVACNRQFKCSLVDFVWYQDCFDGLTLMSRTGKIDNRVSLQYQFHPSCPILWTLGEANQISSFCSEKLPCLRRPEADSDESAAVSGVRLRLLTTPRDLSPSPPLCLDDNLSSLASRWPFVYDDLLIFVRPPLAGLLTPVVLASSLPGESVKRSCCHQRGDNNSKRATSEWRRQWKIPVLKPFLLFENRPCLFQFETFMTWWHFKGVFFLSLLYPLKWVNCLFLFMSLIYSDRW